MHGSEYASSDKSYLKELECLADYLDEIGYADCFYSYLHMPYNYAAYPGFLKRIRAILPASLRVAIRLFALEESVEIEEVERSGLGRFVPALIAGGILRDDSGRTLKTRNLVCEVVDGCYLFVTNRMNRGEILAYFGDDSIKLSRHVVGHSGQRALDVCCGSGIQSVLLARRGLTVVGVDIQEEVIALARINSALNHVGHMTQFVHGDIRDYRPDGRFDIVVSNPPLLPVPSNVSYPLIGYGGESGFDVIKEIVGRLVDFTNEQMRCAVVGTCLGTDQANELTSWLHNTVASQLHCLVWLPARIDVSQAVEGLASTSHMLLGEGYSSSVEQWMQMCKERGAQYLYSFVLKMSRGYEKPGIRVCPLYEKCRPHGYWYVA